MSDCIDRYELNVDYKVKCNKCKDRFKCVNINNGLCRDCFINIINKDFRSNLRTKCIRYDGITKDLIIISTGDIYSTSLIHLLLNRNKNRHLKYNNDNIRGILESDDIRLRCILHFVYPNDDIRIDYGYVKEIIHNLIEDVIDDDDYYILSTQLESSNSIYKFIFMNKLSIVYIKFCYIFHEDGCTDKCRDLMNKLINLNVDVLKYVYNLLIVLNLRKYLYNEYNNGNVIIMYPYTQDNIIQDTLYLTCIGGSNKISLYTSFIDNITLGNNNIIIKPLRTFINKQIVFYHRYNHLPIIPNIHSFNLIQSNNNILGIINNFINDIKCNNPTSLYNVTNITNKLYNLTCNNDNIHHHSKELIVDEDVPEVQSTSVPLAVEASSNYLPLKSIATPGDRGEISETIYGSRGEVNREAATASGMESGVSTGPQVEPESDLRELEGELNRGSCLQDDDKVVTSGGGAVCKTKRRCIGPQLQSHLQDDERSSYNPFESVYELCMICGDFTDRNVCLYDYKILIYSLSFVMYVDLYLRMIWILFIISLNL